MRCLVLILLATTVMAQPQAPESQIKPPVVLRRVEHTYTDEARKARVEGSVQVLTEIGTDGEPHNVRIAQGLGYGLDENAMDCLRQWRFQPGTKDGTPVPVKAMIEFQFRLDSKEPTTRRSLC